MEEITNSSFKYMIIIFRHIYSGIFILLYSIRSGTFCPHITMAHYVDLIIYSLCRRRSEHKRPPELIREPKISIIVPIYRGSVLWLKQAVESVISQDYQNWELCLIDDGSQELPITEYLHTLFDPRIHILIHRSNEGVSRALNKGIDISTGEYLTFLDQDDELLPGALSHIASVINERNPDIIYTDEELIRDVIGGSFFIQPHFKPDFSPDLLLSHNYITHLMIIRRTFLQDVGLFRTEFNGAQDYDLALRATENTDRIWHCRKVLYRWKIHKKSFSQKKISQKNCADAGKMALQSALKRRGIEGEVIENKVTNHYRVKRKIKGEPLVSIIIPFSDRSDLLNSCIDSVTEKSSYQNWEIIGVSNNSLENETFEAMRSWQEKDSRIHFHIKDIPFNYAVLNNYAVTISRGEYIVFMNNDISIISGNWIEELLQHAQREEIGAVGAKLYYPSGHIQHAGVVVGIQGFAGHVYRFYPQNHYGYFYGLQQIRNVSAVTAALMMISKDKFQEIGGFDWENLPVSLNDIDLCLRLISAGYLNLFTPFCEATHFESATRGYETTPYKKKRFIKEKDYFMKRHQKTLLSGDPWYNPGLSLDDELVRIDTSGFLRDRYK